MVSVHGQEGKIQMTNDSINRQQAIDTVMESIRYEWRNGVSGKIHLLNAVYCALENIPSAQSTVDAIPVKWIRKYIKENRLYQSDNFDLYIDDMIADWMERKKNEIIP